MHARSPGSQGAQREGVDSDAPERALAETRKLRPVLDRRKRPQRHPRIPWLSWSTSVFSTYPTEVLQRSRGPASFDAARLVSSRVKDAE
jgi:hypothetical protein